jgi:arylformamidase
MSGAMDMDLAYANSAFIPGGEAYPARWATAAQVFRDGLGSRARLDLPFGGAERQRYDLFLPEGSPRGTVVFIHGGYWMAFDRKSWSHLAAGPLARGWAVAMPSYTLAPKARIAAITREIAQALGTIARQSSGPLIVTGHSAGGHLAARMACADLPLVPGLVRSVPISPLADLEPLRATQMNETLHLTPVEARAESPVQHARMPECSVTVWVGAQERPAFLWQARLLSEHWDCPWHPAPQRHHFDVIDDLADPESLLVETLLQV